MYTASWLAGMWAIMIVSVRIRALLLVRSSMPSSRMLIGPSMLVPRRSGGSRSSLAMSLVNQAATTFGTTTRPPLTTMTRAPMITQSLAHSGSVGFVGRGFGGSSSIGLRPGRKAGST